MTPFAARLVFGVLAAFAFAASGKAAVPTASICDMSQHPDRFYGKLVQVRARVFHDIENATLADVHCPHTSIAFNGVRDNPNAVQLSRAVYPQSQPVVVATMTGQLRPAAKSTHAMPVFDVETAANVKTTSRAGQLVTCTSRLVRIASPATSPRPIPCANGRRAPSAARR